MGRPLPGGRGPRLGPDAVVNQSESYQKRQQQIPKRNVWGISPLELNGKYSNIVLGHSFIHLTYYGILERDVRVRYARMHCTYAVASTKAYSAIFTAVDGQSAAVKLKKVPGTDASFAGDTAGGVDDELQYEAVIPAGVHLFFAVSADDNTVGFAGKGTSLGNGNPVVKLYESTHSGDGDIPETIDLSAANESTDDDMLQVLYMSTEGYKVL